MEKIRCAAIRWCYADESSADSVVTGANHAQCIAWFGLSDIYRNQRNLDLEEQGFLTTTDRFVDRKEAYMIAEAAGQLNSTRSDRILYSEYCNY